MKAVMKLEGKPGIVLREIDKPRIKPGNVLVKVKSAGICGSDPHYYKWDATALKLGAVVPTILGHEFSGEVVEVGKGVKRIKVGDRVASDSHLYCGKCYQCRMGRAHICQNMRIFGVHTFEGAFAEYTLIPEEPLYVLPDSISYEEGALLEPFGVSMHAVEQARLTPGDVVAVFGCGTIGLFIQQIAKLCGASKVIGIGRRRFRLGFAERMGSVLISCLETDVVETVLGLTDGRGVDVVFEAAGEAVTVQQSFDIVGKSGKIVLVGTVAGSVELDTTNSVVYKEATIIGSAGRQMFQTWERMVKLIGERRVYLLSLVTHRYPLDQVEKGFQALFEGKAVKVLLTP